MFKATLKSLLARKLRLTLSTLAVVLSVMFVSGSLVLTDTLGRTFDNLFANVYTYTDVQVNAKPPVQQDGGSNDSTPFPAATVDKIKAMPGVADATGGVFLNGATPIGKNGKVIVNQTLQQFGGGWNGEDQLVHLYQGRGPQTDSEIVINNGLATTANVKVGDTMDVITRDQQRATYTIVGTMQYAGGRDSMAGESAIFFTIAKAQSAMLGAPGEYNSVDVKAAAGVSDEQLRDTVRAGLGDQFVVKTGKELSEESSAGIKNLLKYVNYFLLGFGAVALLVGVFLILNTFSIIVAQRTQELALLRAMGAARGQILRSVLLEAVLIGVVGSVFGFLVGLGLGALGARGFVSLADGAQVASLGFPPSAIIASFVIGIGVTVVAALMPALKASRVAPIAAMRESATPDRPLTRLTIAGAVVTALSAGALIWGLAGAGDATLLLVFGGVLGVIIGVALLTPIISRPLVAALGAALSWSVPGKLGRRNSSRNPRRTAITAGAVMVGIAIVTAISTIFSSLSTALGDELNKQLAADVIVLGQSSTPDVPAVITDEQLKGLEALPQAQTVAAAATGAVLVGDKPDFVASYVDPAAVATVLKVKAEEGRIDRLGPGEFLVDRKTADARKYKLGDTIDVTFAKGQHKTLTLVGISSASSVSSGGIVVDYADAREGFAFPQASQAFIAIRDGTSATGVKDAVNEVLKDNPKVQAYTKDEFISTNQQGLDSVLVIVQLLLLIALFISVLGVINTLLLSVIERTRELGMLRAVGLRRGQTWQMVTTESIVITVFGTVLGLAVGAGLGAAIVTALKDVVGFGAVTLPWGLMVAYFFVSILVGAIAGLIPSVRAVRLNVLGAIAYE
ncbi:FtsX-like permease family protein [Dactylosporangium vinaceum]|uniref:ABC transporter permease n=1 Tax=Dactylosporangium vinaceum TaxID=53362 RepID=A0ABV5MIT1_9ACTN|nr:FtsX-like permease family protein [Dactylosporangium vinaceum]UAB93769.1 FtsX-like permease family protein [Dactylosporangium vinaceum]